ncbi:hypothetical protein CFOL_v3_27414 [Cephalotus follicularis]|uniref:Uncharacterized protein n=1 Tax=Cephalotus follicularis TaxID=3775 RepID=A0A1Q3CUQ3_CEPFO|nr:hypothetical protein CFOL_v3_27414 [Cephalotus follicularis]
MATINTYPTKMQQMTKGDRSTFSTPNDSAIAKQIQATHVPDGKEIAVKPILHIIEDILRRATTASIHGVIHEHTLEDKTSMAAYDNGMLQSLAYIIHKISCELSCKCSGGGDAHATTMVLLNTLSNFSWDEKLVLTLAAFAVNYGEFWLVANLYTMNPLAKSVAILKQLPNIFEHSNSLKPQFDALNKLIEAMMEVTKCIVQFKELPSLYISAETPPMAIAMAHIPIAAYWIMRSAVACSTQIANLIGLGHEYMASTTETWELSSLAHKLTSVHEHLKTLLSHCHQHIGQSLDENKHVEAYHNLLRLFETPHMDNIRNLKALIHAKDDQAPLWDGSKKTRVHVEVLRGKHVLLLISDLDLSHEEIISLDRVYKDSRERGESHYEVVWLPIVDKSTTPWQDGYQHKFEQLTSMMPWHTVHNPSVIGPEVVKFIKEVLHFQKKAIVVPLDPHGRVSSQNALHMIWLWRNLAFPFTTEREETLWKEQAAWTLELLIDNIDLSILNWMTEGKYICLYGGEDTEWIRKFTTTAKAVAKEANIPLEMIYAGKRNAKDKVKKITTTITAEQLSHCWSDLTLIWYFWARLESMLYSKLRSGKSVQSDHIMQEVMTVLSFDGSDQGWAIFWRGSSEMARAKGDVALTSMTEFDKWREDVAADGFVGALNKYFQKLHDPHHCNRLIIPGINGEIPERVVCAECGRPMEKYFMYRCCID